KFLAQAASSDGAMVKQPLTIGRSQDLQALPDRLALPPRESRRPLQIGRIHAVRPHAAPERSGQAMADAGAGMVLVTMPWGRPRLAAHVTAATARLLVLAVRGPAAH